MAGMTTDSPGDPHSSFFALRTSSFVLLALLALCARAEDPAPALTRIGFGSCINQNKPQDIWSSMLKAAPQLFILMGDNIYCDSVKMEEKQACYERLAAVEAFAQLRQKARVLATWDDHDYGLNDAGAEYPEKEASKRVFMDFLKEPADSPRRKHTGVYDACVIGPADKSVQIILLDTRTFRGPLKKREAAPRGLGPYIANPDKTSSMLGEEQWTWLAEQLKVPARLRLLVSSIQVIAEDHGWEKWMNLPHERERLFKLLKETQAAGVLILSGDRHAAEISAMDAGLPYRLYDVTSSSMNAPVPQLNLKNETNRHREGNSDDAPNFGILEIDWAAPDPSIRVQLHGQDAPLEIGKTLRLSQLK